MKRPHLYSLQRTAATITHQHGHRMRWTTIHGERATLRVGTCARCEMRVTCNLTPPQGHSMIVGEALTLHCPVIVQDATDQAYATEVQPSWTNQPIWKCMANLGDRSPIEYGGYFVYVDTTGVYPPEAEYLNAPNSDNSPEPWTLHRFVLEPCTYQNGILSANKFHPDHPVWFADRLDGLAAFIGSTREDLIKEFCSENPIDRAHAWRDVGEYHGFENLDGYPHHYSKRSDLPRRVKR